MKRHTAFVLGLAFACIACKPFSKLPSLGFVPEFETLTDQSGRSFDSKQRLDGKVWVANFIFTTCAGPCPRMTSQFRKIRDEVKDHPDLRMVSFTIDPVRDTPEALATYGKTFGADPDKWYFLTGKQADLHHLSREVFRLGNVDGTLEHSSRFVLVDRQSNIRGYYDSSDGEAIQQLVRDMRELLGASA